jgi:hypothetical protein
VYFIELEVIRGILIIYLWPYRHNQYGRERCKRSLNCQAIVVKSPYKQGAKGAKDSSNITVELGLAYVSFATRRID